MHFEYATKAPFIFSLFYHHPRLHSHLIFIRTSSSNPQAFPFPMAFCMQFTRSRWRYTAPDRAIHASARMFLIISNKFCNLVQWDVHYLCTLVRCTCTKCRRNHHINSAASKPWKTRPFPKEIATLKQQFSCPFKHNSVSSERFHPVSNNSPSITAVNQVTLQRRSPFVFFFFFQIFLRFENSSADAAQSRAFSHVSRVEADCLGGSASHVTFTSSPHNQLGNDSRDVISTKSYDCIPWKCHSAGWIPMVHSDWDNVAARIT